MPGASWELRRGQRHSARQAHLHQSFTNYITPLRNTRNTGSATYCSRYLVRLLHIRTRKCSIITFLLRFHIPARNCQHVSLKDCNVVAVVRKKTVIDYQACAITLSCRSTHSDVGNLLRLMPSNFLRVVDTTVGDDIGRFFFRHVYSELGPKW